MPETTQPTLTFAQAKEFLVGSDPDAAETLRKVDLFFRLRAKEAAGDDEKRLESLVYLVIAKLRLYSLETPEIKKYFEEFRTLLHAALAKRLANAGVERAGFFGRILGGVDRRLGILYDRARRSQVRYFLASAENDVRLLSRAYQSVGMSDRAADLFVLRMDLKRYASLAAGRWVNLVGLWFFKLISGYGTSLGRLIVTCSMSLVLFAGIYWAADWAADPAQRMIPRLNDYSDYLFNSLATITGLGIDASPVTWPQRLAMGINAVYGMVVTGLLVNVIFTRLSISE